MPSRRAVPDEAPVRTPHLPPNSPPICDDSSPTPRWTTPTPGAAP